MAIYKSNGKLVTGATGSIYNNCSSDNVIYEGENNYKVTYNSTMPKYNNRHERRKANAKLRGKATVAIKQNVVQ